MAPWFGTAFWLTGAVVLLSTNLGVLDHMGRLTADVLKVDFLRDNQFWTESRIYFAVIWGEIVFGSIVLLVVGITAPLVLLVISSAINGVIMFVYSVLLIQLNRFNLPSPSASAATAWRRWSGRCCSSASSRPSWSGTKAANCSADSFMKQLWLKILLALTIWAMLLFVGRVTGLI